MAVVKNSLYLALGLVIEKCLSFLIIVFLARYLGKQEFGLFSFLFAFTNIFIFIYDFGLPTLLTREMAKGGSLSFLFNGIAIQVVSAVLGAICTYLAILLLNYPLSTANLNLFVILTLVFNVLAGSFRAVFIAFEEMGYNAVIIVSAKFLVLAGVIVIILSSGDLHHILAVYTVSALLNLMLSIFLVKKRFFKKQIGADTSSYISISTTKYLVKEAVPLSLQTIFIQVYFHIDSVMLSKMQGDISVGLYNAAYKIIFVLMFISDSITMALFPRIAKDRDASNAAGRLYETSVKLLCVIGIMIAFFICNLSDVVIPVVFGRDFIESVSILRIIIWVLPFMFITNLMGRTLSAIGYQRDVAWISGAGAIINIILNIILIPLFSYFGAAIATILTEIWIFGMQSNRVSKHFIRLSYLKIYNIPVIGLIVISSLYAILPIYKPVCLLLIMLLFILWLRLSGYFSTDEWDRFKEIYRNLYKRVIFQ